MKHKLKAPKNQWSELQAHESNRQQLIVSEDLNYDGDNDSCQVRNQTRAAARNNFRDADSDEESKISLN